MPRPAEFWDQLRGVFDPSEVLVGERAEQFYTEREHSPFEEMCVGFRPTARPTRPPMAFFVGHRGSGKSSMLFRLLDHFKNDYFVAYFDIEHNLDRQRANQIDLLYLLGATVFEVARQEGIRPDPKQLQALAEAVYTVTYEEKQKAKDESLNAVELAKGLICFGASMLGSKVGEKLAEAVLKPFTLSSGVSEEVARRREIEPRVQEIINRVNLIVADVQRRAKKPPLVIVDGLDKLERLDQARLVFLESRALRGPVCRIIYTVPMLIFNSLAFGQAEEDSKTYLLPNVRLTEKRTEQPHRAGHDTLREVVAKRLKPLGLADTDVFEPGVLELLIAKSGGVMRWLVGLVQDSCTKAELKEGERVDLAAAGEAIDDRAALLSARLGAKMIDELKQVRQSKRPSGSPESSELLHGLLIVAYRGPGTWFDAHPLIWDEL
jgi:hypothetical protein